MLCIDNLMKNYFDFFSIRWQRLLKGEDLDNKFIDFVHIIDLKKEKLYRSLCKYISLKKNKNKYKRLIRSGYFYLTNALLQDNYLKIFFRNF